MTLSEGYQSEMDCYTTEDYLEGQHELVNTGVRVVIFIYTKVMSPHTHEPGYEGQEHLKLRALVLLPRITREQGRKQMDTYHVAEVWSINATLKIMKGKVRPQHDNCST